MSAGIDSCALLADVQLALDAKWAENAVQKDYIGKVGSLTAIRDNQTATFRELEDPNKDKSVLVYWPEMCDETTAACTDECTIPESEPGTSCKEYALDLCQNVYFSVDRKNYRTIATTYEEAVAKSMLFRMKVLDEWIAKKVPLVLDANKGANQYSGGKGAVNGFVTTIPSAYWNPSVFSYFNLTAEYNRFSMPYLLSGTNLREAVWQVEKNIGNADGKGAAAMIDSMPIYFDIFNIDTQLSPDKSTFLINKGALAFVSKNYYKHAPGSLESNSYGGPGGSVGMKYQVESKNLPGVFYDVTYKIDCSSNVIKDKWRIDFNGGIFVNPSGCNPNNKGILKFTCD